MFVPEDFQPPLSLDTPLFHLEPLGPQHTEADYDAWMSSIDHIKATPGWDHESWPRPMTLEENARDCAKHATHFEERRGFTYTVLSPTDGDVIGCVYIYPGIAEGVPEVQSWMRASHAELDAELYRTVMQWLRDAWPFDAVVYAERR